MTMESDLIDFLIAATDVTALVGTRVFPSRIPQGQATPHIRLTFMPGESEVSLGGVTGEVRSRAQIDNYADTYQGSLDLAEKVRVALVADNNGNRTMGSTVVSQTRLVDRQDEPAFLVPGKSDTWRFNRSLDIELDYQEAAPA